MAWQRVDLPQFVLLPLAAARARLQRGRRAFLGAAASGAGMSGSRSESEAGGPWIAVGRGRRLRLAAERWYWIVETLFRMRRLQRIWGHLGQFLQIVAETTLRQRLRKLLPPEAAEEEVSGSGWSGRKAGNGFQLPLWRFRIQLPLAEIQVGRSGQWLPAASGASASSCLCWRFCPFPSGSSE